VAAVESAAAMAQGLAVLTVHGTCGIVVSADVGAIDHMYVPIDPGPGTHHAPQLREDVVRDPSASNDRAVWLYATPRTKPLGQIVPRRTRLGQPEQGVDGRPAVLRPRGCYGLRMR
jgi:hypothetical protein